VFINKEYIPPTGDTTPSPSGKTVNVSFNGDWHEGELTMPDGWQEYKESDPGESNASDYLYYSDGTVSSYKVMIGGTENLEDKEGAQTGDDSGVVPDIVLSHSISKDDTNTYSVVFLGMNPNYTYKIEAVGSIPNNWDWNVTYTADSVSATLNVDKNTSDKAVLDGVSPDSNNNIELFFQGDSSAVLNAVMITEI
jgi:hypothetical protein